MRHAPITRSMFVAGLATLLVVSSLHNAANVKLNGSGASFPFPIYSTWFKDFSAANKDVTVDYQAKGAAPAFRTSSTARSTSPRATRR